MRNLPGLFILLLFAGSCTTSGQKQTAEEMLSDSLMRKNIFHAISKDSMQMMQFMKHMMQENMHGHSMAMHHRMMMGMMQEDTAMCRMMMQHMMDGMGKDSAMCRMMCMQMMEHRHMSGMMTEEMMCPMHGKMKMEVMKKGEMEHHHK